MKKALLIVNPRSGSEIGRKSPDKIVSELKNIGYLATVIKTEYPHHATQITEQNAEHYDLIICCAGDGTLNEIINGAVNLKHNVPLAYIPSGTTNDTAKTLSLPTSTAGAVKTIENGNVKKCDIGSFNGRKFFCAVTFGFGAKASFKTKQWVKNGIGHFAYILSNITRLSDIKPIEMEIELDGNEKISGEFVFGAAINTRSVGGVFRLDKNIFRINDGKFEVVLVRKLSSIAELPMVLTKLIKKEYDNEKIILRQASNIKFTSPEKVSWLIDGDFGGDLTEATVENEMKRINFCCPDSIIFE